MQSPPSTFQFRNLRAVWQGEEFLIERVSDGEPMLFTPNLTEVICLLLEQSPTFRAGSPFLKRTVGMALFRGDMKTVHTALGREGEREERQRNR